MAGSPAQCRGIDRYRDGTVHALFNAASNRSMRMRVEIEMDALVFLIGFVLSVALGLLGAGAVLATVFRLMMRFAPGAATVSRANDAVGGLPMATAS